MRCASFWFPALRRFRGPALFRGPRPSSSQGVSFWPSGLTLRSSRPAYGGRLTLAVSHQRRIRVNYEDVLYLDLDFLSDIYEAKTDIAPRTVISRKEGMNAEAGIPFLKSGLNSELTKQFTASGQTMLKEVAKPLEKYLEHSPNFQPGKKPATVWVQGALTVGRWGEQENTEKSLNIFFEVKAS